MPLLPRSKKLRTALLVGGSAVIVAVVALLLASTADSGKTSKKLSVKPPPTAAATTKPVKLAIGAVTVQNAGLPAKISPPVRQALLRATQDYFDTALQAPLRHGRVNPAYVQVFDAGVRAPAAHKDRSALTEAATGVIRGPARMKASLVRLDGLGDPLGKLALVAATFTVQVNASTPVGKLTIHRHTELTFAKESGRWVVTAYRVTVRRRLGPKTTTTTAHAGTTA